MKIKSGLLLLCLLVGLSARAQNWGGGVDDTKLHFGFTFQYLASEYKILKKPYWRVPYSDATDPGPLTALNAISSDSSPGFGIGFVVNKRLLENADLRFTPVLVFNDRVLTYHYYKTPLVDTRIEKKVSATLVEFPLSLKLKSDRRNNFRAYVLGGVKYSTDISKKKKNEVTNPEETLVLNKRNFLSYEAGLGFDLYFEYFKMSPEIKLSYSLNSVLKPELNRYAYPIDKLMLRHVTFSLFFE